MLSLTHSRSHKTVSAGQHKQHGSKWEGLYLAKQSLHNLPAKITALPANESPRSVVTLFQQNTVALFDNTRDAREDFADFIKLLYSHCSLAPAYSTSTHCGRMHRLRYYYIYMFVFPYLVYGCLSLF